MTNSINKLDLSYLSEEIDKLRNGGVIKGKSGIHIKKSHEGLFTKKANSAGMGVQEYARHVLANKEDFSTSTIKLANFARNSTKFNH